MHIAYRFVAQKPFWYSPLSSFASWWFLNLLMQRRLLVFFDGSIGKNHSSKRKLWIEIWWLSILQGKLRCSSLFEKQRRRHVPNRYCSFSHWSVMTSRSNYPGRHKLPPSSHTKNTMIWSAVQSCVCSVALLHQTSRILSIYLSTLGFRHSLVWNIQFDERNHFIYRDSSIKTVSIRTDF